MISIRESADTSDNFNRKRSYQDSTGDQRILSVSCKDYQQQKDYSYYRIIF